MELEYKLIVFLMDFKKIFYCILIEQKKCVFSIFSITIKTIIRKQFVLHFQVF